MTVRQFMAITACLVTALLTPFATVRAQRVAGTVTDSASAVPLPGAVVALLDTAGGTVARTLSDAMGRYALPNAVHAGRLRVIRIGFLPRVVDVPRSTGTATVNIAMAHIPAVLAPIEVSTRAICSDRVDRRRAAALWEQARAGLLAAVVAREASPALTTVLTYARTTSLGDERILQQQTRAATGTTTRPFITVDAPRHLADHGYIEETPTGRLYKAPDADVLLDDSFAETHCFEVTDSDGAHPGAIGLAFEPAGGRDSLVDVRGVLWMDAGVPALQSLEFRFTQLEPAALRVGTGGALRFRAMSNGVVFVEQWRMRLPVMKEEQVSRSARVDQIVRGEDALGRNNNLSRVLNRSVVQLSETGGMVLGAAWSDSVRFRTTLAPLTGRAVVERSTTPLAGVVITLSGTADSVRTDSAGRFRFDPVVPGHYAISASDTAFAAYTIPRQVSAPIVVADGSPSEVIIQLPSRSTVMSRMCDGARVPDNSAILFGALVTDALFDRRGLTVSANWFSQASAAADGSQAVVSRAEQLVDVSAAGRFRLCGVPPERRVQLSLRRDGRRIADTVVSAPRGNSVASIEWQPVRTGVAARAVTSTARAAVSALHGRVVRANDNAPLAGVDVWIASPDSHASTDSAGRFRIDGLAEGAYSVQVRLLGYLSRRDTVTLLPGVTTVRDYTLARVTAELDTVRTIASQARNLSPALRAFEDRRMAGKGYFISDSTLRQHDNERIGSVILSRTAGLTAVQGRGNAAYLASSRKMCSGPVFTKCGNNPELRCYATVYIDGARVYSASQGSTALPPDINDMNVNEYAGVEFYAGGAGASAPVQYSGTDSGCGILLLWTRER